MTDIVSFNLETAGDDVGSANALAGADTLPAPTTTPNCDLQNAASAVKAKRKSQSPSGINWWSKASKPLHFLDGWLANLEGDVDRDIVARAQSAAATNVDDDEAQSQTSNAKKSKSKRFEILPENAFYVTPFSAPTQSASEALKIASLQLDRLTAIPAHEAMIAIGGPAHVGSDGQNVFQLFVTKKKTLLDLRRSDVIEKDVEAFVALALAASEDMPSVGGVFRDATGLAKRASRRLLTACLLGLCSGTIALLAYSLQQRFERDGTAYATATRTALVEKNKAIATRTQVLSQLSAFGEGATSSSADRALVTLSDMTARGIVDVKLQMIEVRQGKVRIKGAAKDANAVRMAFSNPVAIGQTPPSPSQTPNPAPTQAPLPPNVGMPGAPPSPNSPSQSNQIAWQDFDIEVAATTVRPAPENPAAPSQSVVPTTPPAPQPSQIGGPP
jgi:hypothetical protein